MATRDVELVIRARDEATKTLQGIAQAVDHLTQSHVAASKGAAASGSAHQRLTIGMADLGRQGEVIAGLSGVVKQLERAEKYVQTTASAIDGLRAKEVALTDELAAASAAQAHFALATERAKAALAATAAEAERAKLALAEHQKSFRAAHPRGRGASGEALALEMRQVNELTAEFNRLKLAKEAAAEAVRHLRAPAAASKRPVALAGAELSRVTASRLAAEERLTKATDAVRGIRDAAAPAAAAIGLTELRTEALGAAAERTTSLLKQMEAALSAEAHASSRPVSSLAGRRVKAELKTSGGATDTIVLRVDERSALAALTHAREVLAQTKASMVSTANEAHRLGAELRGATGPTHELAASFTLAEIASNEARDAYIRQAASINALAEAESRARHFALAVARERARRASNSPANLRRALFDPEHDAHISAYKLHGAKGAIQSIAVKTREAGSATRSLVGYVASLASAYVGLQGAMRFLGGALKTQQIMDAASNKLGVAFGQDSKQVAQEMRFVEATAARLGISFGFLVDQYSGVAVASKTLGATTEQTRKVFLAFAETARVMKLSPARMNNMFLALTHMISLGKINQRELRQLSTSIVGAPTIMAQALGMSTQQLTAATAKKGSMPINPDQLVKIAGGLTKTFGPELPTALTTTTTAMGRLSNAWFILQKSFNQGGFADGFVSGLNKLTAALGTPEMTRDMRSLGKTLGNAFAATVPFVISLTHHLQLLTTAFAGLGVLFFSARIAAAGTALGAVAKAVGVLFTSLAEVGSLGGVFEAVSVALGAIATALGGPWVLGILAAVAAVSALSWAYDKFIRHAEKPIKADVLSTLRGQLVDLQSAYEANGEHVDKLQSKLNGVNLSQAEHAWKQLSALVRRSIDKMSSGAPSSGLSDAETAKFRALEQQFSAGDITFTSYIAKLKELQKLVATPQGKKGLQDIIDEFPAFAQSTALLKEMGSKLQGVSMWSDLLGTSVRNIVEPIHRAGDAAKVAATNAASFATALQKIDEIMGKATPGNSKFKDIGDALAAKRAALVAAQKLPQGPQRDAAIREATSRGDAAAQRASDNAAGVKLTAAQTEAAALRGIAPEDVPAAEELYSRSVLSHIGQDLGQRKAADEKKSAADAAKARAKHESNIATVNTSFGTDVAARQLKADQARRSGEANARLEAARKTGVGVEDAQAQVNRLKRNAFIEDALQKRVKDAKSKGVTIQANDPRLAQLAKESAAEYDALHASQAEEQSKQRLADAEARLNKLIERRAQLEKTIKFNNDNPSHAKPGENAALVQELKSVKAQASQAADQATRLAKALNDQGAVDRLRNVQNELHKLSGDALYGKEISKFFSTDLSKAIDTASNSIGEALNKTIKWGDAWRSVGDAFRNFVADLLGQIGKLLVKKAILGLFGIDDSKGKGKGSGSDTTGGFASQLVSKVQSFFGGGKKTASSTGGAAGGATGGGITQTPLAPPANDNLQSLIKQVVTRNNAPAAASATGGALTGGGNAGELVTAINKSAASLGVNPKDLAAAISYESAGTFNPNLMGGKGGNYQGLIQFGPAERKKYGVHQGQSVSSQMDSVTRYLHDRGVKRGAGLSSIYKAINGGNANVSGKLRDGNPRDGTIDQKVARIRKDHYGAYDKLQREALAHGAKRAPPPALAPLPHAVPQVPHPRIEMARNSAAQQARLRAEQAKKAQQERLIAERKRKLEEERRLKEQQLARSQQGIDPMSTGSIAPTGAGGAGSVGGMFSSLLGGVQSLLGGGAGGAGGVGSMFSSLLGGVKSLLGPLLSGAGGAGSIISSILPMFGFLHSGGIAGSTVPMQRMNIFGDIARMHAGGLVGGGLGPNEVPRILDKSEEVLTKNDPRHIMNGGGKSGSSPATPQHIKVINSFDPGTTLQHALDTPHGELALINHVQNNSDAFKRAIG